MIIAWAQRAGVLFLALTLAFLALRALPGDAITAQLLQSGASIEDIETRRTALGLSDPLLLQYLGYWRGVIRGDLGVSITSGQPVTTLLLDALPPTLALTLSALFVAVVMGLGLGVAAGMGHRPAGSMARLVIVFALSAPVYWTGILAVYIFSVGLGWLPAGGTDGIASLILPAGVLGFQVSGAIARATELALRETRGLDFVRTAHSKGLRYRRVLFAHVLRVGLLPVVTVIALQAGFLLGGTVITEVLFVRPGVGRLLLDATLRRDYPVIQGVILLSAGVYLTLLALADALAPVFDPRVRVLA